MRKILLSVIILTVVLFVGVSCDRGKMLYIKKTEPNMTLLKIERGVKWESNPVLAVLAKKVRFDHKQRIIVIEGLVNIAGDYGGNIDWIVPGMSIKENCLFIQIPKDSGYNIQIGDNYFYLPLIK